MGNYSMNVYQKNILNPTWIEVAARLKDLQACIEISGLVKIDKCKSSNASMKKKLVIKENYIQEVIVTLCSKKPKELQSISITK